MRLPGPARRRRRLIGPPTTGRHGDRPEPQLQVRDQHDRAPKAYRSFFSHCNRKCAPAKSGRLHCDNGATAARISLILLTPRILAATTRAVAAACACEFLARDGAQTRPLRRAGARGGRTGDTRRDVRSGVKSPCSSASGRRVAPAAPRTRRALKIFCLIGAILRRNMQLRRGRSPSLTSIRPNDHPTRSLMEGA